MDSMSGGAFGGAKAGAPFDPVLFAKKPAVILRSLCLLFSIIVFGCISSQGWVYSKSDRREMCLYNRDSGACNYGVGIGVIAFLASIAFLAGEYLFEQMSSVKTRKHYVLGDLGFSGFWAFLYFVGFCYLANQWSNTAELPAGIAVGNVKAAIAFSFFSIFTWGGCAYLAFLRFRSGSDSAFAPSYDVDSSAMPGATAYSSYPGGADGGGYQEPPFGQSGQQKGNMDYSSPNY